MLPDWLGDLTVYAGFALVIAMVYARWPQKGYPMTAEWLLSLGFNEVHDERQSRKFIAPDEYFEVEVTIESDGNSSLWVTEKPVCDNPTQEQVRALFKGLCLQFPNGTEP